MPGPTDQMHDFIAALGGPDPRTMGAPQAEAANAGPGAGQGAGLGADAAGDLGKPSYVAGQARDSLSGGPVASAGDSYFVTGGYKGQLLDRAKGIRAVATKFNDIGTQLQKQGAGGFLGMGEKPDLITGAKNMNGTAQAFIKLADEIDKWTGGPNKESIEKGSKASEYVSKLIDAADAIIAAKDASLAVDDFTKKPNADTVDKWADNVGNMFEKAGGLIGFIPSGALPDFVADYYKGLFSAPKNYINAFKTIMKAHYKAIDEEIGYSSASNKAYNMGLAKTTWQGELTGIFVGAYTQDKDKNGGTLEDFMTKHRKTEGGDLYEATLAVGKAKLVGAIGIEMADDDPTKQKWIDYISKG